MLSPRYRVSSKARSYVFLQSQRMEQAGSIFAGVAARSGAVQGYSGNPNISKAAGIAGENSLSDRKPDSGMCREKLQNMAKRFLGGNDGVIHTNQLARQINVDIQHNLTE